MTENPDERRGAVTAEPGGGRRLVFRRSWPDPIDDVWAALTDPERTSRWIGSYAGPHGAGAQGSFTMTAEAEPFESPMTIVECEPPRRLVVEWTGPFQWRVELDLAVEDGRTVLVFTQVFPTAEGVGEVAAGWHWYLDKLDAELTGRPHTAEWDAFLAEVGPGYSADPA